MSIADYGFAIWETFYVTVLSTAFALVLGLPLGVLLVAGDNDGILPLPGWLMHILNIVINILRSVPFLILMICVFPLTRAIVGTTVGTKATIVPLVVAAFPFVARLVETSLRELDEGVVEEICDSVAILDGGVVMEEGSVQEIFANPKTAAAKRLVAPNGGSAARDLSSFAPDDHVVRVTFNGSSTAKPLVASLAAEKGILVSVLSADTRDLSGQCYGSMLLKLPADVEQAKQAAAYMRSQPGVTVEEVTGE